MAARCARCYARPVFAEFSPGEADATRPPLWRVRDMAYGVGLLVLSLGIVAAAIAILGAVPTEGDALSGVTGGVSTIAFELLFGASVLLLAYRRGLGAADLGFVRPTRWRPAVFAWSGAYGVLFAYGVLLAVLDALGVNVSMFNEGNPLPVDGEQAALVVVVFAVAVVLVAPFAEELFFRALIFRGTRGYWGVGPSLLLSGLAFGLFHLNPSVILPFAGIGVLFAWANEQSGSLWTSITAHAAFNAVSFALSLVVET